MRVNVYAEEMTDRIEVISKTVNGEVFTGVRFWLELPVSSAEGDMHISGPFMHGPGDDDSSAVTFWGKDKLRGCLQQALDLLEGG